MIHLPVFSVWTFTSSSKDQEAESVSEEDANPELEPSTESQRTTPWNGSEENTTVPSITDQFILFKPTINHPSIASVIYKFYNVSISIKYLKA